MLLSKRSPAPVALVLVIAAACLSPARGEPAPQPAAAQDAIIGPGIYVSDPARSLRFYVDGIGMKLRLKFGPKDRPDMVVGYGMDPSQPGIMLLSDNAGPVPRPIAQAHGFDRIALRVTDLAGVLARLRAAGFAVGEARLVHGSIPMVMISDHDGYKIELVEIKAVPRSQ